jgi:two-component sensor histidine kinase
MDRGQTVRDSTGRVASVVGVLIDITVIKEAEERQQLLINELNHRVKNTLAIVKSMASQTLRATPDPQAFAALFAGRLEALSGAHALLTDRKWDAVALADLVRSSVSPFIDPANRISIKGPHIDLPPNTTITLGLMLHELGTNASKHGALSTPQGIVSIAWSVDPGPEGQTITLRWTEQGGPHVQPSNRIGFGSRLLDASAAQLDGEMTADFERTGLRWSIVFSVKATPNVGMDYAG